jgi:hypothetical protein
MSTVNRLSDQVTELAERASAMSDAAQGKKGIRGRAMGRWLLLPAAGAGFYAMVKNKSVTRKAKDAMGDAKTRASELPEELMGRVRQSSQPSRPSTSSASSNGGTNRRRASTNRRRSTTRSKASSR